MPDPVQVRAMFGRIAGRYDLLNRTLSVGIDQRWRKRVLAEAGEIEGRVLVDACCGTGDLALAFAERGARVVGVDFTPQMLTFARRKDASGGTLFAEGDALKLPIVDAVADFATVAFGIRNVADRVAGLAELARVVKPGGRVFVLEFSMPPGKIMGGVYRTYFTRLLPVIGGKVSGDRGAYEYLPETVLAWPSPAELQSEMEGVGMVDCGYALLTRGVACLSWGRIPTEG